MSNYNLSFKSSAAKEFRKLSPQVKQRITDAIERLIVNPRDSGVVKLKGDDNLYRLRVGDYRIVYEIDDLINKITVTRIRHRRDVYR
jgi:mRNA interferase RelE/StbE